MSQELQSALAWFKPSPGGAIDGLKDKARAVAEWVWVVLQGDFAGEQTTAQAVTGTVVSMIPFVDQICDVRDIVANCKKINDDSTNKWAWFALVLTLIGLFPTLGSFVKGCFKVLFAYGRKNALRLGHAAADSEFWEASKPFIEASVVKLNDFLSMPAVRATLSALRIDAPYKYLAAELRKLAGQLNVGKLTAAFDTGIGALKKLLGIVQRCGSAAMQSQAGLMLQSVQRVRMQADRMLGDAIKPAQDYINRLAQRLDVEHRLRYSASTNAVNPHHFTRTVLDAEIGWVVANKPAWVEVAAKARYRGLDDPPLPPPRFPDISGAAASPLTEAYKTFHKAAPAMLPPGTVLYRVLDPGSADNSACWMTKAEFDKLRSKADWRERFAVWRNWNHNGEFTTYTVPPGPGLPAWKGPAASQQLRQDGKAVPADDKGNTYWIPGGAEQVVVNPRDLERAHVGQRQFTGWGYDEGDIQVGLVGVPILQTNWRDWSK
jgi:hypothetical protein